MNTAVSTAAVLLLSTPAGVAQALPSPPDALVSQTTPLAQADAGFEFEGFGTPNTARITDTIDRGECPGEKQGNVKARFYSSATPPGGGRRVVIRNVSRGLAGDHVPRQPW